MDLMTIFYWIIFFVILYTLALRPLFSMAARSVAANLAISRAQILSERQGTQEKKAGPKLGFPPPALSEAQAAAAVVSAHHQLAVQQKEELARIDRELAFLPIEKKPEQHRRWFKLIVARANITSPLPPGYWERRAAQQRADLKNALVGEWLGEVFSGIVKLAFGCLVLLVILEGIAQLSKHHHAEPTPEIAAVQAPLQGDSFDRAFAALLKAGPVSTPAPGNAALGLPSSTPLPLDNGAR